ncbi:hypothetical protein CMV_007977 [Castanea mollissima]|uniref:Uncharacterized protein n=1 Tax=Castanea mollissima TaxID=60419 RepID=A0A8J4RSL0_9ROSI|nr:hypothetical protein CMV_007977 [Castanea mollissima]
MDITTNCHWTPSLAVHSTPRQESPSPDRKAFSPPPPAMACTPSNAPSDGPNPRAMASFRVLFRQQSNRRASSLATKAATVSSGNGVPSLMTALAGVASSVGVPTNVGMAATTSQPLAFNSYLETMADFEIQGNASSSTGFDPFVTPVIIPDSKFQYNSASTIPISVSNSAPSSVVHSLPVEPSNSILADLPSIDSLPSSFPLVPPTALPDQASTSTIEVPLAPIRKSTRPSKPPAYLQDYSRASTSLPTSVGAYDIAYSLTYAYLVPSY